MIRNALLIVCGFIIGALVIQYKHVVLKQVPVPIATLPDGSEYEGALRQNKFHGQGRMTWPNNRYYKGEFRNGLFHGFGYLEAPDRIYEGQFKQGLATGTATITFIGGDVYRGEVEAGMFQGTGILENDTFRYSGQFDKDRFHGSGKLSYTNGSRYEGEFANSVFEGFGELTTVDGQTYRGTFVNGELTGKGDYFADSITYHGEFKNGLFHGQGTYIDKATQEWFEGEFDAGVLSGTGSSRTPEGAYTGDFLYGVPHGQGESTSLNGDVYVGEFLYGAFDGQGTLTYAEPLDGLASITGQWQKGLLIESDSAVARVVSPSQLVETALYKQQALLERHFKTIKKSQSEHPQLYFLGVAGDGTQGVFRRELETIHRYFNEHLGTQDTSMLLVNSNKWFDDYPFATNTSIHKSMNAMAQKMNLEQDILFVYLTSHGLRDHKLSLQQPAISLNNLPAQQLGEWLKASPIKWKVVVVSACFSGGFIPEIKDKYTLVITAAAADKASFGCADRNKMTYFGEAFFNQALPKTNDFSAAFKEARELIKQRELAENVEPSNPQIYKPQAIMEQLSLWKRGLEQSNQ